MAEQNHTGERVSGSNGGTSGTFATETAGSAVGAGATGQGGGSSGGQRPTVGGGRGDDTGGLTGEFASGGEAIAAHADRATPDGDAGDGQGDDLAAQLGGDARGGINPMTPQAAVSGDLSAGRSEGAAADPNPAALGAGDVGGMGGARASTGHGNPPGGVSPMGSSRD